LEKVACGAFSDISFVSAGKKRGFCQLRSRGKCKSDRVLVAATLAAVAAVDGFIVDFAGAALVAAGVLLAFVPVGGADEPPMVSPACSRFVTDFVPSPFTRLARSSASLNGPFFVRSSMIAFDFTGPSPFTASREVWSAVFTSTAANATPIDNARARHSINSFLSMTSAPG